MIKNDILNVRILFTVALETNTFIEQAGISSTNPFEHTLHWLCDKRLKGLLLCKGKRDDFFLAEGQTSYCRMLRLKSSTAQLLGRCSIERSTNQTTGIFLITRMSFRNVPPNRDILEPKQTMGVHFVAFIIIMYCTTVMGIYDETKKKTEWLYYTWAWNKNFYILSNHNQILMPIYFHVPEQTSA